MIKSHLVSEKLCTVNRKKKKKNVKSYTIADWDQLFLKPVHEYFFFFF